MPHSLACVLARFAGRLIRTRSLVFGVMFSLAAASAKAQTTTIWVDESHANAGSNWPSCNFASGQPGSHPSQPLKGTAGRNGVIDALACVRTSFTTTPVNIYVLCTAPVNGYCDYDSNMPNGYDMGNLNETADRVFKGWPDGQVRIKHDGDIEVQGANWHIEGLRFDGKRTPTTPNGGTFIRIRGSGVKFTHNWVGNVAASCLRVGDALATENPINVEISHNRIDGCYSRAQPTGNDDHCIYTYQADDLKIMFNDLAHCSGDGFQILNQGGLNSPFDFPDKVASNVMIVGNRFWTSCMTIGTSTYSFGENAIDIKRAGLGLRISDNQFSGYRSGHATNCLGTGDSLTHGETIVLHGSIGDDAALLNGAATPCTAAQALSPKGCLTIEGNDFSDVQQALTISGRNELGPNPQGVFFRGNFVHDLRGEAGGIVENRRTGVGLWLSQPSDNNPGTVLNRIYRNTFANIPGDSIRTFGTGGVSVHFDVKNNVVAWTGSETGPAQVLSNCRAPDHVTGGPTIGSSYWHKALTTPTGHSSTTSDPGFLIAHNQKPDVDATAPGSCGLQPGALPGGFEDGLNTSRIYYDYRIAGTSPLKDVGTAGAAGLEAIRQSDDHGFMSATCGTGSPATPDIGADEACGTQIIFMEETPKTTDLQRANEIYGGPEPFYLSEDISVVRANTAFQATWATGALPFDAPMWNSASKILLKVRHDTTTTLAHDSDIRVRVFQARAYSANDFPSGYNKVVDVTVKWCDSTQTCTTSGTGWELAAKSPNANVFAFPWSPVTVDPSLDWETTHSCLRAEISTPTDPRPPFFTHTARSNNLAQRNISIEPHAAPFMMLPIFVAPPKNRDIDGPTHSVEFEVYTRFRGARSAYLYIPKDGEAGRYIDSDKRDFPPPVAGGIVALKRKGINRIRLQLPADRPAFMQVLIDNTAAGPPASNEYVLVKESRGGAKYFLVERGFRESFEFGIPPTWSASGLWRAVDRHREPTCGAARFGRKAAAYNSSLGCNYEAGPTTGELVSPYFTIPKAEASVFLKFAHWSQTRETALSERPRTQTSTVESSRRRLYLSVKGGPWIQLGGWGDSHEGGVDRWIAEAIDLSAYKGSNARIKFVFDAGRSVSKGYRGWYVDDIEVE